MQPETTRHQDGSAGDANYGVIGERYAQYRTMQLADLPVIALRIDRATSWGNLAAIDGSATQHLA